MSWIAVGVGSGAGLLKAAAFDAPRASRQRKLAGETQRYSPWTHLKSDPVQEADPFGNMLQFGATGASMGAGLANQKDNEGLVNAQMNWLNRGGSPVTSAAMSPGGAAPRTSWLGMDYNQDPNKFWGM